MTISTKKPLYAEVHNVPDDYEFTDEELNRIIAGDMFTPRQDAIMAREIQKLRAAMLHGAEPVSQTYKLPPLSSSEVNDAAWKLHNMLTEHVPLNGRQFNNLKGCFYEALKVAMRNYPVTPDSWISCSERMPEETGDIIVVSDGIVMSGISYSRRDGFYISALEYDDDEPIGGVTHWMPLPEPPQGVK
ncbi:DUF551 domain-containing protein [Escherichia coli]|uniref:DUF551 domain-containing protein n=1 Tax=Escherichia coli TaxID=562 RepID=UPI000BDFA017|nr:DUF551 domain-containing protein [Escherichia coli]EEQ1525591.1 DUF551 domain-containing protein [Escherichia coli]EEQ1587014.1 DUF551 domain-containing protein [Escherichia coli]EEQ1597312.1 DUF551 domain-containing protein [Escherichia coli]EEQ3642237.1 DUF551 domain-containing protein [Escherichia coli]